MTDFKVTISKLFHLPINALQEIRSKLRFYYFKYYYEAKIGSIIKLSGKLLKTPAFLYSCDVQS